LGRRLAAHRKLSRRALLPGTAAIAGGLTFGLPGVRPRCPIGCQHF
jgi:hypothetical protein